MTSDQEYFSLVRKDSQRRVTALGYRINPALPLLETGRVTKSARDIACRMLVLHACCAVSYGFSHERATAWIRHHGLMPNVSAEEMALLGGEDACHARFRLRPEAVWLLGWVLGKAENFKLYSPMPLDAVRLFPDLRVDQSPEPWLDSVFVRDTRALMAALDFYYCLHWAWRDGAISAKLARKLPGYVISERRRALEWCLGSEPWDTISLDT